MQRKIIIANWKSNPSTLREAENLAKVSDFKNVVIAPPSLYLERVGRVVKRASLGSQNVFWQDGGPYTGETSPTQLKNLKVKYVIVGHSERRRLGETDEMINKKTKAGLKAGLRVILCVGEDLAIRRRGVAAAQKYIANQFKKDLKGIQKSKVKSQNLVIAYEPVWAIGTGKSDTPRDSVEIIKYIKKLITNNYKLKTRVLYGGSVTPKNVKAFLSQPEINGALVGNASLKPQSFKAIIKVRDSV